MKQLEILLWSAYCKDMWNVKEMWIPGCKDICLVRNLVNIN